LLLEPTSDVLLDLFFNRCFIIKNSKFYAYCSKPFLNMKT
jgi:hypothetical protein